MQDSLLSGAFECWGSLLEAEGATIVDASVKSPL